MSIRILQPRDQAIVDGALTTAVLFGRDDLQALRVDGRDAVKFLNAMVTQDIKQLSPNGYGLACLCDAQGAMVATLRVVVTPDVVALWTDRSRVELLRDTLDRYIIADDVELTIDDDLALCELVGPSSAVVAELAGLAASTALPQAAFVAALPVWHWQGSLGAAASPWMAEVPAVFLQMARGDLGEIAGQLVQAGALPGSHAAREALRIASGEAKLGIDIDDGSLPLEAGLALAVSFRKGCYLGQEAIAMMKYRGQLRRHLCWVTTVDAEPPKTTWQLRTTTDKRAGRMGSSVVDANGRWLGLALIQRKAYVEGALLNATGDNGESATVSIVTTTIAGALALAAPSAAPTGHGPS